MVSDSFQLVSFCMLQATYGEMVVRNNFEETSAAYKVSYLSVYPKDQVIKHMR